MKVQQDSREMTNKENLEQKKVKFKGLVTLLEGVGLAFDFKKCSNFSEINYRCFKAVKLVNNVIIVNFVSFTIFFIFLFNEYS